jgi:hypothetical protein
LGLEQHTGNLHDDFAIDAAYTVIAQVNRIPPWFHSVVLDNIAIAWVSVGHEKVLARERRFSPYAQAKPKLNRVRRAGTLSCQRSRKQKVQDTCPRRFAFYGIMRLPFAGLAKRAASSKLSSIEIYS